MYVPISEHDGSDGNASVRDLWGALHTNLYFLCCDRPLDGAFLRLFEALER